MFQIRVSYLNGIEMLYNVPIVLRTFFEKIYKKIRTVRFGQEIYRTVNNQN